MADLSGIRAKIERAEEHIADVQVMVNRVRDSYQWEPSREFNPETKLYRIFFRGTAPPIPDRLKIVAGEAIHQLRSALDHLVCQMIIHESELLGSPEPDLARRGFPIFHKQNAKKFARMIEGISVEAKAAIEGLQPYRFDGAPQEHYLFALGEFDNIDKHRLLLVVSSALVKQGVSVGGSGTLHFMNMTYGSRIVPLEDGVVLWEHIGDPGLQVNPKISVDVAFPKIGLAEHQLVVVCLQQLRNVVVSIVNHFEAGFF